MEAEESDATPPVATRMQSLLFKEERADGHFVIGQPKKVTFFQDSPISIDNLAKNSKSLRYLAILFTIATCSTDNIVC